MTYIVYAKTAKDKKFKALASLRNMEYAFSLMYAAKFPMAKLGRLEEWKKDVLALADSSHKKLEIEIRHWKDTER